MRGRNTNSLEVTLLKQYLSYTNLPNTHKNVFAELAFSILCNPHKQRADDWITAYVSFASSCIPAVYAKPDIGSLFC